MTDSSRVIASADLGEFFRTEVLEARSQLNINLKDATEHYLVNLLCDYSRLDNSKAVPGEEPLALMYKRALEAPPDARVKHLKNLGDLALYVASFFTEFIERSLVDLDYYISMGGNAYGSLSGLVGQKPRWEAFALVYDQLAAQFTEVVDLLSEIADRSRTNNDGSQELLKLYDRWNRTGSDRIRKLLLEKGLIPSENLPTEYLQ